MPDAGGDGGAKAAVAQVMIHADVWVLAAQLIGERPAAVVAAIVHEQHLVVTGDAASYAFGLRQQPGQIIDLIVDRIDELVKRTISAYPKILEEFKPKIIVDDQFVGEGYGLMSEGAKGAIELFAKTEGILLDPVYTGKAGLALLRLAMAGEIGPNTQTLFYHTGGSPALFAHAEEFR